MKMSDVIITITLRYLVFLFLAWYRTVTPGKDAHMTKTCITALIIANNKMKHLVIQLVDGVYYVSDRSFRSRIGVPLICKKTILAKCILSDAHTDLGHGRDVLQVLTHIQTSFFIPRTDCWKRRRKILELRYNKNKTMQFQCSSCSNKFTRKRNLKKHYIKKHNSDSDIGVVCFLFSKFIYWFMSSWRWDVR